MELKYTEKALADALADVPLFAGASAKQRKTLARLGKVQSWKEGREIVQAGAKGAAFFMILSGTVDVVRDGRTVAQMGSGEFFGEIALLADQPRNATVTATSNGSGYVLSRTGLAGAMKAEPSLGMALLAAMAERQSPI